MSNTLTWRVQGIVRDAKGSNNIEYVIYAGDEYTVVERINGGVAARAYLETRAADAIKFGDPKGRYAKMHQREMARRTKKVRHHGKTVVLHQRKVKTLSAALKVAQQWHDDRN